MADEQRADALKRIEEAAQNRAKELNLSGLGLTELPPEIWNLTNLTRLDLDGNQLTALPPEIVKLTKLTRLDLDGNQLTALPPEIVKLTKLTRLHLDGNQLTALPPEIGKLTNLTELYLHDNQLTALPSEIVNLTNLTSLHLGQNQLSALPSEIVNLTKLTSLGLDRNQLTALPSEIVNLTNLTRLYLHDNQLTALPPEIGNLTNLTELYLYNNRLTALPPEIVKLTNLTNLHLGYNQLTALSPEIGKLTNLTSLHLWCNQLTALPPEIGNLINLTKLLLGQNQLTALPSEMGDLTNLTELYLDGNQLTELPPEIGNLTKLTRLDLHDNPGLNIPPEILGPTWNDEITKRAKPTSPQAIFDYYFRLQTEQTRPLNEAKVILVGQGSVGKTSLVRRLIDGTFDEHEDKTPGINIRSWPIPIGDDTIRLNVWDFGGQEIMHATHQFFLTRRSLYILVLDSRISEVENRLEYWLKIIRSFGGDSPVIVVGNKSDQQPLDIDRSGLMKKYPSIRAILETSCAEEKKNGINELREEITKQVDSLKHIRNLLPESYFNVKSKLEEMKDRDIPHIPYEKYASICAECKITCDADKKRLIGLLHDLGIMLNYSDDLRVEDTNVLNPKWVTDGVYTILNSNLLFQNHGVLELASLHDILDQDYYPRDKHKFIIEMMEKFELCFDIPDREKKSVLVPDLLPKQEGYTGDGWEKSLAFEFHYDVLPPSVISRFIVRMHSHIHESTYWRTGVMLSYDGCKAKVKADIEDNKMYIEVQGPPARRRAVLTAIRTQLDAIHGTITSIQAAGKVPLPDNPKIVVDFQHLLDLEEMGEATFVPQGMKDKAVVKDLLNGIEPEEDRMKQREERGGDIYNTTIKNPSGPVAIGKESQNKSAPPKEKESWHKRLDLWIAIIVVTVTLLGFFGIEKYSDFFLPTTPSSITQPHTP